VHFPDHAWLGPDPGQMGSDPVTAWQIILGFAKQDFLIVRRCHSCRARRPCDVGCWLVSPPSSKLLDPTWRWIPLRWCEIMDVRAASVEGGLHGDSSASDMAVVMVSIPWFLRRP
jgi:hypothetical protein